MGNLIIQFDPAPGSAFSPDPLEMGGCNIPVGVCEAVSLAGNQMPSMFRTYAHIDTGGRQSGISPTLSTHLGLRQIGLAQISTANGTAKKPTFYIDLSFPGSALTSRIDLTVVATDLPFSLQQHTDDPLDQYNYGILIGRDVLSRWHMTWNGRSSTVIISD